MAEWCYLQHMSGNLLDYDGGPVAVLSSLSEARILP